MIASQFLIAAFAAVASANSLVAREDAYFASLLKRQEPGTPAYSCHESCGGAITLSRTESPCTNDVFVTRYNNCLKCSGPDNFNIWRYYGGTLGTAGTKCGFSTEPLAGKQDDSPASTAAASAPPAAASSPPAAATSSPAAATTQPVTSEAPVSSAAISSAPLTTVVTPVVSSASALTTVLIPTISSVATRSALSTVVVPAVSSILIHSTVISNGTLSSISGVPSPSSQANATFTSSAPTEVTTNAAAGLRAVDAVGVVGAVFVGALFGM